MTFENWFHEPELYGLRSERFDGDVAWLRAAWEAGRSAAEAEKRRETAEAREFIKHIADAVFLACIKADSTRYTGRLGIRRSTTCVEYAQAAKEAVLDALARLDTEEPKP